MREPYKTYLHLTVCSQSVVSISPNTKRMQANIQISIAVSVSAFGEFVVTLLKMLTSTRKSVIKRAILPDKKLDYNSNNYYK